MPARPDAQSRRGLERCGGERSKRRKKRAQQGEAEKDRPLLDLSVAAVKEFIKIAPAIRMS